jgi:hypothetical protein
MVSQILAAMWLRSIFWICKLQFLPISIPTYRILLGSGSEAVLYRITEILKRCVVVVQLMIQLESLSCDDSRGK